MGQYGIDAHVIEGRHQGTRTTLTQLIRAISAEDADRHMVVFVSDVELCKSRLGITDVKTCTVKAKSTLYRLLISLPYAIEKSKCRVSVWQYICSPFTLSKKIVFIHDILPITNPEHFPLSFRLRCNLFFRFSMLLADKIITVSEHGAAEIVKRFPSMQRKIEVVRNGPSFEEAEYFQPLRKAAVRYVMTVGRIERRKNIALLIEAFEKGRLPDDVELIVVGKYDLGYEFPSKLHSRVKVLTNVSDEELIDLYRGADLFVYPSSAEGFGLPLLDAILFGLPVISSNKTSMPEIGTSLVTYFDPDCENSCEHLAKLMSEHFEKTPITPATIFEREAKLLEFSWRSAAVKFISIANSLQVQS